MQVSSIPKEPLQELGVNNMVIALRNASGVQASVLTAGMSNI